MAGMEPNYADDGHLKSIAAADRHLACGRIGETRNDKMFPHRRDRFSVQTNFVYLRHGSIYDQKYARERDTY